MGIQKWAYSICPFLQMGIFFSNGHILHKDTVFFFLGKNCGHSLTRFQKNLYFFFRTPGKKKYSCIFFFPEKDYMSLTQLFWMSLYKKIGGKLCFFKNANFNHILRCIFFSKICIFFLCIFFFLEKIKLHSLTRFKPLYFFFRHRKKKIHCFYSLTRFWTKLSQKWSFPGKQKNTVPLPHD